MVCERTGLSRATANRFPEVRAAMKAANGELPGVQLYKLREVPRSVILAQALSLTIRKQEEELERFRAQVGNNRVIDLRGRLAKCIEPPGGG